MTRTIEGSFGLMLGFAFARLRLIVFHLTALATAVFLGVAVPSALLDTDLAVNLNQNIGSVWVPGAYVLGAAACALQWYVLWSERKKLPHLAKRRRRLFAFAACLALMGGVYFWQALAIMEPQLVVIHRFIHGLAIWTMSFVVMRDYRDNEIILRQYRISKYHRRSDSPEPVEGLVFINDLKKSTAIRDLIGKKAYAELLSEWFTRVAGAAAKFGGEVLWDQGDSIAVFFDGEEERRDSLENTLAAAAAMLAVHGKIEQRYGLLFTLAFRASLTRGLLYPKWKPVGGQLLAGYEGDILVEAARTLELERSLSGVGAGESIVIVAPEELRHLVPRGSRDFYEILASKVPLIDKEGKKREVAAIKLVRDGGDKNETMAKSLTSMEELAAVLTPQEGDFKAS